MYTLEDARGSVNIEECSSSGRKYFAIVYRVLERFNNFNAK